MIAHIISNRNCATIYLFIYIYVLYIYKQALHQIFNSNERNLLTGGKQAI